MNTMTADDLATLGARASTGIGIDIVSLGCSGLKTRRLNALIRELGIWLTIDKQAGIILCMHPANER